jgi:hypothetical protein
MNPDLSSTNFQKEEFLQGKQIVSLESSSDQYQADAVVVWCFDDQFSPALAVFLKEKNLSHKDLICIAGGLKTLASPDSEDDRVFVLGQIRASIALHRAPRVYLMVHSDCGKYGGLKAFGGDPNKELEEYRLEAKKATDFLIANLGPSIQIEPVFADFQGVWKL